MKIDFYVLETASYQQSLLFACRLIEKNYATQNGASSKIFVHTNTKQEADRLDALLWTYSDNSFLPHQLYDSETASPIQIGFGETPHYPPAVLLNLSRDIPAFYQQCEQLIEIVFTDTETQQFARQRYKQYRDQGYEINTIKLATNEISTSIA